MLAASFVLMSLGIVAGSVLAHLSWGPYWYLDPRQVWSMLIWLLFAAVLLLRYWVGFRGRKAAMVTLVGVTLMLIGVLGVDYSAATKHPNFPEAMHEQ